MLNTVLLGAIAACCLISSLYFLRFWKESHDRLFLYFACSFVLMAINRIALALLHTEHHTYLYLVRMVAFLLIIIAIADKNTPQKENSPERLDKPSARL